LPWDCWWFDGRRIGDWLFSL